MQAVNRLIADRFSDAYAGEKIGFAGKEITEFFAKYSNVVRPYYQYGIIPKRQDLFIESLYSLSPKEQYYALTDLCTNPPPMKYIPPSQGIREDLLAQLHSSLNIEPIGICFSTLREHIFREDWVIAYNRISSNPGASITAARTLLETTFKTIISERHEEPSTNDLSELLKQVEHVLQFDKPENQEEHRILNGLTNIINGVAGLSNKAGDRHGLIGGDEIENPSIATLVVNACGTVAMFFIERHLFLLVE
jgi:hypothetical protein